jgi:hypothetical protein
MSRDVQRNRVENTVKCVLLFGMHAYLDRLDYVRYIVKQYCRADCNTLTDSPEYQMQVWVARRESGGRTAIEPMVGVKVSRSECWSAGSRRARGRI